MAANSRCGGKRAFRQTACRLPRRGVGVPRRRCRSADGTGRAARSRARGERAARAQGIGRIPARLAQIAGRAE